VIAALAKWCAENGDYTDIAAMLPDNPQPSPRRASEPKTREGFVYLIKSGDFYKVGQSDDLERRGKEIRIALSRQGNTCSFHSDR